MSFLKAEQLLALATRMAGRRVGVSLEEVTQEFGVTWRTAQRMIRAVERSFPDVIVEDGEDRRRHWRLPRASLGDLLSLQPEELAALDLAPEILQQVGQPGLADQIRTIAEKVRALVPPDRARRIEPDHEALLEAQGLAFRPGPRPRENSEINEAISHAIKAGTYLDVLYRSRDAKRAAWVKVAPLGVLLGLRRYLVALRSGHLDESPRMYRIEAIRKAKATGEPFVRPADFDMRAFARKSFGSFHSDKEYGEVVWRFSPKAAAHAASFVFHPDQVQETQSDGSLLVRFSAAGHLEMCWHLYAWGDQVEVIQPEALRELCHRHRRDDFPALP